MKNIDAKTVSSFGDEWVRFDQSEMSDTEALNVFKDYFSVFPWSSIPTNAHGFDMGCGSGRWARLVAPRVGRLNCIDPSAAINIARENLSNFDNIYFYQAAVGDDCLALRSQDFGYSLGVLHHVPDTSAAISSCVRLLKPGGPLLLYLYYAFDNRPWWYQALWKMTDLARLLIYRLPSTFKILVTDAIATLVYWPLARVSRLIARFGLNVRSVPLSYYRELSFYTMRTDARDRFGTPLEKRFTRSQIERMMLDAGLVDIRFSESAPYWCAVGIKA